MPVAFAAPGAVLAGLCGPCLAWRESRRPRLQLKLHDSGLVEIDGIPVDDFQVAWRGALAFVSWRDGAGRRQRRVWWPDRLPAASRRELRLAVPVEGAASSGAPVAH